MKASTKIDLGALFRYITALDDSDFEVCFLQKIFSLSKNLLFPETCENLVEIRLPINFSLLKKYASKYGFTAFWANQKAYICWQKVSLPETPYCDIAEFFRQIQRVKFSETTDSLERFEICKEICDILYEAKLEYKFQHLFPVHLAFCSEERANLIAKDYGFHVTTGGSGTTYLGIASKIPVD